MASWLKGLFIRGSGARSPSYREARKLAADPDPSVRRGIAARADTAPEILFFLADDPAPEVRRAIAANRATPAHADRVLAGDADHDVRGTLADKIGRLAPTLSADARDKVGRIAYDTLEALAQDQVARVRRILAEALKDATQAPPAVIRRLARDAEEQVASPVLQFSPLLTDEDLLEIIASNPTTARLCAISQRAAVAPPVADAVAGTDDEAAIVALLTNPNAQIREETLDKLIDRAEPIVTWHGPLVRRPRLPARAAAKLARFVADGLLAALQARSDLSAEAMEEVRRTVDRRLAGSNARSGIGNSTPADAMNMATELQKAGRLDESMVGEAVRSGDREFAIAALAVRSGLDAELIRKVAAARDAKGMTAIAWKARFGARLAETLQLRLARVRRDELVAAVGDDFALDAGELEFQIDLIKKGG